MELFHTSPEPIKSIKSLGLFGSFLCFAPSEYVMTAAAKHYTYKIEIDDDEIIPASRLFYHEDAAKLDGFVQQVMNMLDCDEDEAIEQIEQRGDFCGDAEQSWEIQRITAEAAKALGFRGVSMSDEQGFMVMVDMLGKEGELEEV